MLSFFARIKFKSNLYKHHRLTSRYALKLTFCNVFLTLAFAEYTEYNVCTVHLMDPDPRASSRPQGLSGSAFARI
jgi:hypothetical protein